MDKRPLVTVGVLWVRIEVWLLSNGTPNKSNTNRNTSSYNCQKGYVEHLKLRMEGVIVGTAIFRNWRCDQ